MARAKQIGVCCICRTHGELSFEHVPPEAAFNNTRVRIVEGLAVMGLPLGEISGGQIQQRGAGAFTLCVPCNTKTGGWYGGAFAEWCAAGADVLRATRGRPTCIHVKRVYPLRIMKQILTMFCSIRGVELVEHFPELTRYLLNKEQRGMPAGLRVFVHYANEPVARQQGFGVLVNGRSEADDTVYMSELVFPPLGYLLLYNDNVPDGRLVEITDLGRHAFGHQRDMEMSLPLLPAISPFPGDYRTRSEILDCQAENLRELARLKQ